MQQHLKFKKSKNPLNNWPTFGWKYKINIFINNAFKKGKFIFEDLK